MVEPPRSFGRGNSDHEKQKTDTGVLCAFQHFKYSDHREAVLHNIVIEVMSTKYNNSDNGAMGTECSAFHKILAKKNCTEDQQKVLRGYVIYPY